MLFVCNIDFLLIKSKKVSVRGTVILMFVSYVFSCASRTEKSEQEDECVLGCNSGAMSAEACACA